MKLPMSWREVNLLEVCEINPKLASPPHSNEEAISLVRYNKIDTDSGEISDYESIKYSQIPAGGRWFKNGDIIIATRGPNAMKCALVEDMPTELGIAQNFLVLRPTEHLSANYLLHFMQQPWFQKAVRESSVGTSHQISIPSYFFRDMVLPLPPRPEQEALVSLFQKASPEKFRKKLSAGSDLLQLLAQELMISGIEAAYWPMRKLSDICSFNPPRARPREKKFLSAMALYYSPSHVNPLTYEVNPERATIESLSQSCGEVCGDDVLFSPGPNVFSQATVCVVIEHDETTHFASGAFQVYRPHRQILPEYLAEYLRLPWVREQIRTIRNSQGRMSRSIFNRMELPLPSIEKQQEILSLLQRLPTTRLNKAFQKSIELTHAMYIEGFSGQLSRRWRESYADVLALVDSVQSHLHSNNTPADSLNPALRTARKAITTQLSIVQLQVWSLLCERRLPLLSDDYDAIEAFCKSVQTEIEFTPAALKRALKQLSALGLIRHMSIPSVGGGFMSAFRRCRVDGLGRSSEDSAHRDAQLFRESIEAPDQGF